MESIPFCAAERFWHSELPQSEGTDSYCLPSFPYSNVAYCQLFRGENCEYVCQAFINLLEYIGGVPKVIVFDNATGIGHRFGKILKENPMFQRFRVHYGFESRFCNPNSGHEKGPLNLILVTSEEISSFQSSRFLKTLRNSILQKWCIIVKNLWKSAFTTNIKSLYLTCLKRYRSSATSSAYKIWGKKDSWT